MYLIDRVILFKVTFTTGESIMYEYIEEREDNVDDTEISDEDNFEDTEQDDSKESSTENNLLQCLDLVFTPALRPSSSTNSLPGLIPDDCDQVPNDAPPDKFPDAPKRDDDVMSILNQILREIGAIKEEITALKNSIGDNAKNIEDKTDNIKETLEKKFNKYILRNRLTEGVIPNIIHTQTPQQGTSDQQTPAAETTPGFDTIPTESTSDAVELSSYMNFLNNL